MKRIAFALALGAAAPVGLVASPAAAQAVPADLGAQIDAYLASAVPADGPGVAVIVTERGKTVHAAGRGLADIAGKVPVTPDTVFRIGSITKQFSSAVLLQLVDEGKVSLDDPLTRYVPGYPAPGGTATVRQLLNHTSGIQSYTGIPGWMTEAKTARAYTTAQLIAEFRDLPSPFQPGADQAYNNSAYVLVGAVIEAVTGKPWHAAVAERITGPLGLRSIRYGDEEASMPLAARPYTAAGRAAQAIDMSVPHAAGALVGSVRDLATWAQALHHGKVVSAASYAQMIAPTKLASGRVIPYGLGLATGEVRGAPTIGHGGGIFGGATDSLYVPGRDIFVAVFANTDAPAVPPSMILRRVTAMALGKPYENFTPVPADIAALQPMFGVYAIDGTSETRRFLAREGKLYMQRGDRPEQEVFAAGGGRYFFGPASLTWFGFGRDAAGAPVIEMRQNGADAIERAVRTGAVPPAPAAVVVPRAQLERNVGRYALGPVIAAITLGEGDVLSIQLTGQPAFAMRTVSATEFAVDRVGAKIVFSTGGASAATLTLIQGGREQVATRVAE